jgi:hypothetical protein
MEYSLKEFPKMQELNIDTPEGEAIILYGKSLDQVLAEFGYKDISEAEPYEKERIQQIAKTLKPKIKLIKWNSAVENSGFGRSILSKIFDLAEQLGVNTFTVNLQSLKARFILKHYCDIGVLEPVEGAVRGGSFDPHPIEFRLKKRPKNISPSNQEITLTKESSIRNLIEYCNINQGLDLLNESEYHGRKITLNKPSHGDVKKYKVYVKNPKTGKVIKVNFGDKNMEIRRDNPERKKSFRARHKCDQKNDKTTAGYWSCKFWSNKKVSDLV